MDKLTQLVFCRRQGYPQKPPRAELLRGRPHEAHLLRGIPARMEYDTYKTRSFSYFASLLRVCKI